jgi:hypothetical protein
MKQTIEITKDHVKIIDWVKIPAYVKRAEKNGCSAGYQQGFGFFCDCDDELHFCDSQCSLISPNSANRKRK